jgi:hypothetical protein
MYPNKLIKFKVIMPIRKTLCPDGRHLAGSQINNPAAKKTSIGTTVPSQ